MPMYEYYCDKCEKSFDRIVKFSEDKDPQPCPCDPSVMCERIDVTRRTGLQFKGRWYKTMKSY